MTERTSKALLYLIMKITAPLPVPWSKVTLTKRTLRRYISYFKLITTISDDFCVTFFLWEESSAKPKGIEVVDAAEIPGWDKVDNLARAVISLDGLATTNSKADNIEHLYNELADYDKRQILFQPHVQKPSRR